MLINFLEHFGLNPMAVSGKKISQPSSHQSRFGRAIRRESEVLNTTQDQRSNLNVHVVYDLGRIARYRTIPVSMAGNGPIARPQNFLRQSGQLKEQSIQESKRLFEIRSKKSPHCRGM
jgi:hypothetical protein